MTEEVTKQETDYTKLSAQFGWSEGEIATIQHTVAKGTSKVELAYFLSLAKSVGLNPFNKEIWCYKDGKGNLLIFSGRDGFLKKAQQNPTFNGMRSSEVCEKDAFGIDIANNVVNHTITNAERGKIIGAYAIVFRKDGEPTVEWVEFAAYNKGFNAWKTHPAEMIKKVAESHALKKAFGITGVQIEYDYDQKNNTYGAVNTLPKLPDQYFRKLMLSIDSKPEEVREVLEQVDFDIEQKEQLRAKLDESAIK